MTATAAPRRGEADPASPARPAVPRREVLAFRGALAVILLAVADDAFVHPEPGTGPADHLASGLVPIAIGVTLALAYPRLRAGLRAIAALTCGTLAVVAGTVDGYRHIAVDRLAGDDATAVLAGIAGGMLIGLAVTVLWRTRRLDERLARRYGRRLATGVACLIAAYLVLLPAAIAIVATHKARSPVAAVALGARYERVTLTTHDGLKLAAWYVPSRNGAAIIAFPGRSQPVPHARMLVRHGYGVLLLDRRGEGESEGDYNAFGWGGEADVAAAVGFLRGRPDVDPDRIGGLGLSVGGELLIQAAAHTRALGAVVSEGAGVRSLAEHLHTPGVGRVQRWFSNWVVQTGALAVLSNASPPEDLTKLVARISPRALMLIEAQHGAGGEELNRCLSRGRRRAEEPVAGQGRSHGRPGGTAGRVRAACRRVLRPRAQVRRRHRAGRRTQAAGARTGLTPCRGGGRVRRGDHRHCQSQLSDPRG